MKRRWSWFRSIFICFLVLSLLGVATYAMQIDTPTAPVILGDPDTAPQQSATLTAEIKNSPPGGSPTVKGAAAPDEGEYRSEKPPEGSGNNASQGVEKSGKQAAGAVDENTGQNPGSSAEAAPDQKKSAAAAGTDPAQPGQQAQDRGQQKQPEQAVKGNSSNNNNSNTNNNNNNNNKGSTPAAPPQSTQPEPQPSEPAPPPAPAPVTYSWGSARTINFRSEVRLTNNSGSPTRGLVIYLPMLENNSPYQETSLQSTNYPLIEKNGRIGKFEIGDLEPGESKTLVTDYKITMRTVAISSTNDTVELARQAYQQYAGNGNCYTLASAFVKRCRELGLTARIVNGFARPQRADITAGSLQGCRHSWAEFKVEGLGWVPVDLTFEYFGKLPYTSHIVETYADESIRVNFIGGTPDVAWVNSVR